MRVSRVKIKNILGIEDLEFAPGRITKILGRNGSGKTSVLEAIKAALLGGHDATLVRSGAEEGQVWLDLDGDDGTTQVRKRIEQDSSSLGVKRPQVGMIGAGQRFLNSLVDRLSFNPVAFITADAKKRVDILLKALAMPMEGERLERLESIAGTWIDDLGVEGVHALTAIDATHDHVFAVRREHNRIAREKSAAAEEFGRALPPASERATDWSEVWNDAEKALLTRERAKALARTAIDQAETEATDQAKSLLHDEIAKAREVFEEAEKAARRKLADNLQATAEVMTGKRQLIDEESAEEIADLTRAAAEAGEKAKVQARTAGIQDEMQKCQDGAAEAQAASETLTAALDGLKTFKQSLLDDLPISGMEIRDGEVYVNGTTYDRLSAAERVTLAIQVARIRAGDLPLILVDGAEALDAEHMAVFDRLAAETPDLQFIVAQVSESDLQVITTPA